MIRSGKRRKAGHVFLWKSAPTPAEYSSQWRTLDYPRPSQCPACDGRESLIGHGFSRRWLGDHKIGRYRWRCKSCSTIVVVTPAWMIRYVSEPIETIKTVLIARARGKSWAEAKKKRVSNRRHTNAFRIGTADTRLTGQAALSA